MKKSKKIIAIFCVICLSINLLLVHASDDLHMDTELLEFSNRIPILTLDIGGENGEVGYGGSEQFGYTGPASFAVEDGVVYVLDAVNNRINVYENETCTEIAIDDCYQPEHMAFGNGKLAVVDNNSDVTLIYTLEGNLIKEIAQPEVVKKELVSKIVEIGESYVVWKTFRSNYYRYDWIEDTITTEQPAIEQFENSDNELMIFESTGKINQRWEIDSENKFLDVLGVCDNSLVYQQYEYVPNVDMLFTELSVRKVNQDGSETYAIVDFSEWKAPALDPFYLSSDGIVYVMECINEETVISKLVLGTIGVTHMEELYQLAEARRLEVKAQKEQVSVNGTVTTPAHVATRSEVLSRAEEMINYEWKVLSTHKDKVSGYENAIIIPTYILTAENNTYVEGIPYCWGGYHGLAGERYQYQSFESVSGLTNMTAGNLYAYPDGLVWGTIGLDCVGFVMSAYDMAGSKLHSSDFVNIGEEVSFGNMKPMDILARNGHVMLYGGMEGDKCLTYEALGVESVPGGGRTNSFTRLTLAEISEAGYVARTLFCSSCDQTGKTSISSSTHVTSCSVCGYKWPNTDAAHNIEIVQGTTKHTYICSACDYERSEFHNRDTVTYVNGSSQHTCTCSICGKTWSEAHTFANGSCDVCGMRHGVFVPINGMPSEDSLTSNECTIECE
ncbi:MAG: hypothetical protein IJA58_05540 [Lachnospiraceae bacterium]|nr:hypothetical protein [Lachnospiraceae bacterium]